MSNLMIVLIFNFFPEYDFLKKEAGAVALGITIG